jgi:two-component system chemotaxis response regulator CheY
MRGVVGFNFKEIFKKGGLKMKALIVDDSRAMRLIIGKILTEIGFEIIEAKDGAEAMKYFDGTGQVDLALVDWNLPNMNGLELITYIRSNPLNNDICVIMCTSETEKSRVTDALSAGANEYVMKPFTRDVMLAKLELLGMVRS